MITIIRRGVAKSEKEYVHTCKECRTVFSFHLADVKFHSGQRDGTWYTCQCPHEPCSAKQYIYKLEQKQSDVDPY